MEDRAVQMQAWREKQDLLVVSMGAAQITQAMLMVPIAVQAWSISALERLRKSQRPKSLQRSSLARCFSLVIGRETATILVVRLESTSKPHPISPFLHWAVMEAMALWRVMLW